MLANAYTECEMSVCTVNETVYSSKEDSWVANGFRTMRTSTTIAVRLLTREGWLCS